MTFSAAIPPDDPGRRLTVADSEGGFARYLSVLVLIFFCQPNSLGLATATESRGTEAASDH